MEHHWVLLNRVSEWEAGDTIIKYCAYEARAESDGKSKPETAQLLGKDDLSASLWNVSEFGQPTGGCALQECGRASQKKRWAHLS